MSSPDWMDEAACAGVGPDLFFAMPAPNDNRARNSERFVARASLAAAKALCASCDVREACLDYALRHNQWDGVWGGLDPDQRRIVVRTRRRSNGSLGVSREFPGSAAL